MIDEIYGIINTNYYCDYCINGSMYIPRYQLPLDYIINKWTIKKTAEAMEEFKINFPHPIEKTAFNCRTKKWEYPK
jgi:hypothetical protein